MKLWLSALLLTLAPIFAIAAVSWILGNWNVPKSKFGIALVILSVLCALAGILLVG